MSRLGTLCSAMLLLGLCGEIAFAQTEPADTAKPAAPQPATKKPAKTEPAPAKQNKAPAKAKPAKITPEREAELLSFVRQHHPELADLLDQLKPMKAADYQAALLDLERDVRKLEPLEKKMPSRYEVEVSLWKSRSRIRLLSARLSMSPDDGELRDELKGELRNLRRNEAAAVNLEIETVRQQLDKQQRRLEQLQKQSADLQANSEEWVTQKLSALERESQKGKPADKKNPAKAKTKPAPELKTDSKDETRKGKL